MTRVPKSLLDKILAGYSTSAHTPMKPMPVRPTSDLLAIKRRFGGAVMAAMLGKINAEEFLKLEAMNEH